jgi:hypothetical protein
VQPGGDGRGPAEGRGALVGLDHGVLHGFGGVLGVGEGAHGDGPEPAAVAAEQLAEGLPVAADVAAQQLGVARGVVPRPGGRARWEGGGHGLALTGRRR